MNIDTYTAAQIVTQDDVCALEELEQMSLSKAPCIDRQVLHAVYYSKGISTAVSRWNAKIQRDALTFEIPARVGCTPILFMRARSAA